MPAPSLYTAHETDEQARKLADFVLFSQRNCLLKLSPELSREKLSYPQFFLLTYLAEEEGLSMTNIAKMMGHSTAASTGMVDKLQELGYTQRSHAASDRRKILVRITPKGREIVETMRQSIAQGIARMMATPGTQSTLREAQEILTTRNTSS